MPFPLHLCCETWKLVPQRFKNFSVMISAFPFNCLWLVHLVHTFQSLILSPRSRSLSLPPSLLCHTQGIIKHGGEKPNIIPAYTEVDFSLRTPLFRDLPVLKAKAEACFRAAALATGCQVSAHLRKYIYKNKKKCCFPSGTPPAVCTVYPLCRLHTLPLHNTILSKKKKKKKVPMLWVLNPLLHNSVLTSGHLSPTSGLAVGMPASH